MKKNRRTIRGWYISVINRLVGNLSDEERLHIVDVNIRTGEEQKVMKNFGFTEVIDYATSINCSDYIDMRTSEGCKRIVFTMRKEKPTSIEIFEDCNRCFMKKQTVGELVKLVDVLDSAVSEMKNELCSRGSAGKKIAEENDTNRLRDMSDETIIEYAVRCREGAIKSYIAQLDDIVIIIPTKKSIK